MGRRPDDAPYLATRHRLEIGLRGCRRGDVDGPPGVHRRSFLLRASYAREGASGAGEGEETGPGQAAIPKGPCTPQGCGTTTTAALGAFKEPSRRGGSGLSLDLHDGTG